MEPLYYRYIIIFRNSLWKKFIKIIIMFKSKLMLKSYIYFDFIFKFVFSEEYFELKGQFWQAKTPDVNKYIRRISPSVNSANSNLHFRQEIIFNEKWSKKSSDFSLVYLKNKCCWHRKWKFRFNWLSVCFWLHRK